MTATAEPRRAGAARKALTDEEKLERVQALEGAFYDAANMAGIAWDVLSGLFEGSAGGEPPELVGGVKHCHVIDPDHLDRLHFAVSHAWSLTEKLKDDLLKALYEVP
ncbi:MAG: hypothetical protein B7Y95_22495 [Rhizobiales bacterium 32-66-11]|nr:MAG: hypothetical protein B7Y95_22495 [Rhizobiales bacterium 32-66-11]